MRFETLEELKKLSNLLAESDFERADCRWEGSVALFVLETARPPQGLLAAAGLFRKSRPEWVKCRLLIRHVRAVSIWEEYDVKPSLGGLVRAQEADSGFRIELASAHGLRVAVTMDRLDVAVEDAA